MIFPKQRRRLRNELNRKDGHVDVRSFYSLKREGFDFLLDVIERRDGTPRQLGNALSVAWDMRGWGRSRYVTLLPALCAHEDAALRAHALYLLLMWTRSIETAPGEKVEGLDETRLHAIVERALELGVNDGVAHWAKKYLERLPVG